MTGWMFYDNGGLLTAHADILLTNRVGPDISLEIPALGMFASPTTEREEPQYVPCSLCQKLVIVDDKVAYIWAGLLKTAIAFDSALREMVLSGDANDIEKLNKLLLSFSSQELQVLIWTSYNFPATVICSLNASNFHVPSFGNVFYGGSGSGEFYHRTYDILQNLDPALALEKYEKGLVTKEFSDSVVRQRLMDSLLQFSVLNGQYNHVQTGAFLETLSIDDNGNFQKGGIHLYVVFDEEIFPIIGFKPIFIVKRFYVEGFLGISVTNYGLKTAQRAIVGSPFTYGQDFRTSLDNFDPFNGLASAITCIYVRESNIVSHFPEDPKIFYENFTYCEEQFSVNVSEFYRNDAQQRRRKTDERTKL